MSSVLLPTTSTRWERALADAMPASTPVGNAIGEMRRIKYVSPLPSMLPYLVYEYGLGELAPYIPNLYDLISNGIAWQRVRGTPAAMAMGLGWLSYQADIEEESVQRRYWNLFQLHLDRVRDNRVDLDRIAGVARLSVPKRSVFWRGFHGFDIRPLTYSDAHYSESHYGEYSGRRLADGAPLWSFGRSYEFAPALNQADLEELDVWLEPVETEKLGWGKFSWASTRATWRSSASRARSEAMAAGVAGRPAWFVFLDASGEVIGYRRARAQHFVTSSPSGVYSLNGSRYEPAPAVETKLYLECLTGFGEGDGAVATAVGIVFDAIPADPAKPGAMWLTASEISGGTNPVAVQPIDIHFGEAIRERVKMLFSF